MQCTERLFEGNGSLFGSYMEAEVLFYARSKQMEPLPSPRAVLPTFETRGECRDGDPQTPARGGFSTPPPFLPLPRPARLTTSRPGAAP